MLYILLLFTFVSQVIAQRGGGDYGGYRDGGYRGDYQNQETALAQIITQTQTQIQTQVQTQTRTMFSTALSMAPTTIVKLQATTVVEVATILTSSIAITSASISESPLSTSVVDQESSIPVNQFQNPLIESTTEGLTVDASPSASSATALDADPSPDNAPSPTRAIGAATEVSAPVTRLSGTVPTGTDYMTTGRPNLDDGAQGVVYGDTTSSGTTGRIIGSRIGHGGSFGWIVGVLVLGMMGCIGSL